MGEEITIGYLEEERKKLWERVNHLEGALLQLDILKKELEQKCSADELKHLKDETLKTLPTCEREARNASKEISRYKNRSEENAKVIEQYITTFAKCENDIKIQQDDVNNTCQLIEDLHSTFSTTVAKTEAQAVEINEKHKSVTELLDGISDQSEKTDEYLEGFKSSVDEWQDILETLFNPTKTKIEALRESTAKDAGEIRKAYESILGVSGLKEKLETAFKTLQTNFTALKNESKKVFETCKVDFETLFQTTTKRYDDLLTQKEEAYRTIKQQIESLLPAAVTTGLAYAYQAKREHEEKERKSSQNAFYWAIGGMISLALIPVAFNAWMIFKEGKAIDDVISTLPSTVLLILPLYAPALWVAYSANKRMNQSKRLIEEYAHKEALSKTFEGLSTQIRSLEDAGMSSDLSIKLLYSVVKASSDNPGELIKGFNKPDNPILDVLDKTTSFSDSLARLREIPGLGKLVDILQKKSEKKTLAAKEEISKTIDDAPID